MKISYINQVKNHLQDPLFKNSYFLMANMFIFSVVGFLFWIIAARLYSTEEIGIASAIISVISFFSIISLMGFDISLIRYLSKAENKQTMINSCFSLTILISSVISIIFLLGLDIWSPGLKILRQNYLFGLLFIIFTIFASLSSLQLSVFVAFRKSKLSFYQSLMNTVRLIMLPLLYSLGALGIYASFGVTYILTFLFGNKLIKNVCSTYTFIPTMNTNLIKKMFSFSVGNFIANVLIYIPSNLFPLLLLNILGAETTAYFYIAWTLSSVLLTVPGSVSKSLFAEGSFSTEKFRKNVFKSVKLSFMIIIPSIFVIILFGKYFLLLFGNNYAKNSLELLIILSFAAIPHTIIQIYTSIKRIETNINPVIYLYTIIALITVIGAYIITPKIGLTGAGYSWLIANIITASIAIIDLWRK